MKFGINFFPTVSQTDKPGSQFYDESLDLCALADELGYSHVKTVEHYFFEWGGMSPDPVTFLTAAAMRTERIRVVTGAVLPAFSHPIKLAAKLALLDNLSHGRLDVGFARAFLPDEFEAFQVSIDESRPRFDEGIEAITRLWTEEEFRFEGQFHQFGPHPALLPRPYQKPHPPTLIAATFNPQSFEEAGRNGHGLMIVPYVSTHEKVAALLDVYRGAWADAGHGAGKEQIHLSYHCYLAEDPDEAYQGGKKYFEQYKKRQLVAVDAWRKYRSDQYPGYENLVTAIEKGTFEAAWDETKFFIGSPDQVISQIEEVNGHYGVVEPSLQMNYGNMPVEEAERSIRLFAEHVMPKFQD